MEYHGRLYSLENTRGIKMNETKKSILKEIKKHKGELGVYGLDIVKLVGFKEDEEDYYYYCETIGKGKMWLSCVGRINWLIGLPKEDYKEILRMFNLNYKAFHEVKE